MFEELDAVLGDAPILTVDAAEAVRQDRDERDARDAERASLYGDSSIRSVDE